MDTQGYVVVKGDDAPNFNREQLEALQAKGVDLDHMKIKVGDIPLANHTLVFDYPFEHDFDDLDTIVDVEGGLPFPSTCKLKFSPRKKSTGENLGEPVILEDFPLSLFGDNAVVILLRMKGNPIYAQVWDNPFD